MFQIEYPELLVLPVTAAQRLLSSHGYSNRSSLQRSESSCTASVNGSTANQSTASSVAKNEGNVHHSESGNNSLISEPPAPVLQLTTLHRPAHNVTSHNEGKLNNGVLEKLDPDGQSSARTIVRSGSSHILHNRAGRDSAQSSFYRRWPGRFAFVKKFDLTHKILLYSLQTMNCLYPLIQNRCKVTRRDLQSPTHQYQSMEVQS